MKTFAVYRVLYEDFLYESVMSIKDIADEVFVFVTDTPWMRVKSVEYKGELVRFPSRFPKLTIDKLSGMSNVHIIDNSKDDPTNVNQITRLMNTRIAPTHGIPDVLLFIEPDMVFAEGAAAASLKLRWNSKDYDNPMTNVQVEMWKGSNWRVPYRKRLSAMWWRLRGRPMPRTGMHANSGVRFFVDPLVYNLGFSMSEETMYWKHMTSMAFSKGIGDSPPDPAWYDRWLNWKPGDKNLEISMGHQHAIPKAIPYGESLPSILDGRFSG